MDGSESERITPPEQEPRLLRWATTVRQVADQLMPVVAFLILIAVIPVLVFNPELRDPAIMAMIGGSLMALGGLGLRGKR